MRVFRELLNNKFYEIEQNFIREIKIFHSRQALFKKRLQGHYMCLVFRILRTF